LRYGLSYRDIEELLAERGITVDHVTIYRWVQRFTPEFIEAARPARHLPQRPAVLHPAATRWHGPGRGHHRPRTRLPADP
jgi:hypothetical protein